MAKPEEAEAPAKSGGSGAGGEVARVIGILGLPTSSWSLPSSSSRPATRASCPTSTTRPSPRPPAGVGGRGPSAGLPAAGPLAADDPGAGWRPCGLAAAAISSRPTLTPASPPCAPSAAIIALASAVVTWSGRISSALWTGLLAAGLWWLSQWVGGPGRRRRLVVAGGPGGTLGVLVVGAAVLGADGLVLSALAAADCAGGIEGPRRPRRRLGRRRESRWAWPASRRCPAPCPTSRWPPTRACLPPGHGRRIHPARPLGAPSSPSP